MRFNQCPIVCLRLYKIWIMKYLFCDWEQMSQLAPICWTRSNRQHNASPPLKNAHTLKRENISLVSGFIFNFDARRLVDVYQKHLKDFEISNGRHQRESNPLTEQSLCYLRNNKYNFHLHRHKRQQHSFWKDDAFVNGTARNGKIQPKNVTRWRVCCS